MQGLFGMVMDTIVSLEVVVAAVVGSIAIATLNLACRHFSARMQRAKFHSVKWIRVWYFRRVKKRLLRIQDACEDALVAQRKLSRCATCHLLFLVAIILFPCLVMSAAYVMPEAQASLIPTMVVCSILIFAFEIPWVAKSKFLDDLTKYRKSTRSKSSGLAGELK